MLMLRVEDGIELRVVVHLHLAIDLEAPFAGEDLVPKLVEAIREVAALLFEDHEAVMVAEAVGVGGGLALGLFAGVVDLQGEDGEAVDDEAGGLSGAEQFWLGRAQSRVSSMRSTRSLRLWLRRSMACLTVAMFSAVALMSRAMSSWCQRSKLARCWSRMKAMRVSPVG
jgi:hypothetical protein